MEIADTEKRLGMVTHNLPSTGAPWGFLAASLASGSLGGEWKIGHCTYSSGFYMCSGQILVYTHTFLNLKQNESYVVEVGVG